MKMQRGESHLVSRDDCKHSIFETLYNRKRSEASPQALNATEETRNKPRGSYREAKDGICSCLNVNDYV